MAQFLLILRGDPSVYANYSPEQFQDLIGKFEAWATPLMQQGLLVDGKKLTDQAGKFIEKKGGKLQVKDGPYGETKELVGGFYVLKAESYDHAVELCKGQPNFDLGGTIEVRELDFMGQPEPE